MTGKLIVLEGTDGSGKSTQFRLLCERLKQRGTSFQRLVFPQYSEPSSALIRMYLGGEFGTRPSDVNPYAASTFYAVDRYASWKTVWSEFYQSGGLVLSDRYTTSNAVHQGSKLSAEKQAPFFDWLCDLEYNKMGLPRPDIVIYLDMPTEHSLHLLRSRENLTNTKGDIHEVDPEYLAHCRQTALRAAAHYHWHVISCIDKTDHIRELEDIHREILDTIEAEVPALRTL